MLRKFLFACAIIGAFPAILLPVAISRENARLEAREYAASGYMIARVVGYDCDGASGPLLASQEDELPRCEAIEALPQPFAIALTLESE